MLDKEKKKEFTPSETQISEEVCKKIEDTNKLLLEERIHESPVFKRIDEESDIVALNISVQPNSPSKNKEKYQPSWKSKECTEINSKALILACSLGNVSEVWNLLRNNTDPNLEEGATGPLHAAAYRGSDEIVRMLLEEPITNINAIDGKGKTALHLAAMKGNHEVIRVLLETASVNVNAVDDTGRTALHTAATSPFLGEVPTENFRQCIMLLLNCPDMKVNLPDKEGFTALGQALTYCEKDLALAMLTHNRAYCLNIDIFHLGYYRKTLREVIYDMFPNIDLRLPQPLQENSESHKITTRLLACLQNGNYCGFRALLKIQKQPFVLNHWYDEPYHSTIVGIACQMKKKREFVEALLQVGANPNTRNPITNQYLLHLVSKTGNLEALKLLVNSEGIKINVKDSYNRTPLHCLSSIHCKNSEDLHILQHSINLLFGDFRSVDGRRDLSLKPDLNATTYNGETPLHIAARMGEKETVLSLLRHGADLMYTTGTIKPPVTYIDPTVMENYLDECIDCNEESPLHDNYMLIFDYNFLHPYKIEGDTNKGILRKRLDPEMAVIKFFSSRDRFMHLLKHPTISSFLQLKWNKIRHLLIIYFMIYSIFLIYLTWYCVKFDKIDDKKISIQQIISISVLSVFLLIIVVCELYQLIIYPKIYLSHSRNWMIWIVILLTVNVSVERVVTIIPQCRSIALLLGWTQFVFLIGGFPEFAVQFEMLKTVAWTFFKFIICYCPLFFAFGICFYTMFRYSGSKDDFFSISFGMSMLKIFVMFTGEVDATGIPFHTAPYTSHIVFTVFVFLVAIVLFNLLNGLAVSDAQTIMKDAKIWSLSARVNLISYLKVMNYDRVGFFSNLEKLPGKKLKIFPNRYDGRIEVHGKTYENRSIDTDTVHEAILLANKRKESKHNSDLTSNGLRSDVERKIAELEQFKQDMNKKMCYISEQLNVLSNKTKNINY
ncbi:hypothetical protein L9F63_020998 [Diploptera punctata]|uniref:Ion transport domain-containing protein n=1 Tax=Diploptera punctata TaxID=6984 RepID=A0AAD7ZQ55_DIPPU|nr:hypothetical protein L9F63_020998 [Diploptera punctata]